MFQPAVKKHNAVQSIGQTRQSGSLSTTMARSGDILKQSPLHNPNASQISVQSSEKNPLKRTASQIHQPSKPARATLGKTSSMGVLSHLHEDLYFDENDFDDDIDLDEDPMLGIKYPSLVPKNQSSRQSVQYPELPPLPLPASRSQTSPSKITSSAPLPWSSSPIAHRVVPSIRNDYSRENVQSEKIDLTQETPARPSKRRNLPWDNVQAAKPQTPQVQSRTSTTVNPPPWNSTASAIKQEQTALRQRNAQSKKAAAAKQTGANAKKLLKGKTNQAKFARVFLSDEQKSVLDLVSEQKQSVFFTGSAGTGKSVLMREIIKKLRLNYAREPDRIAVTASTGLAACNVSGVTLHSFAGIGLGKEPAEDLIKKIKKNSKARNRWLRAKVLIIDEISMVDGKLFDKLEKIARGLRNDGRPFGGIQLVVTGDFFQLPPVPDGGQEATFAFDANTWTTVMQHTIGLTQVFRQKDPVFANMLNEMRVGKLTQSSINAFHKLHRQLNFEDSIDATELFPTRDEVERANRTRMQQLQGRPFVFDAIDGGTIQDVAQRDKMLNNCMAAQQITLKKGAQVMLIKNLDDGLVNGSIGRVIAFMDERTYDLYLEDEDSFQPADAAGMDNDALQVSRNKIKDHANKDATAGNSKVWPLVSFPLQDGTTRQLLCVNEKWTIELPNGEIQASRGQIPLILAWALSIHKAQGQTLERVKVNLGKVFEKGQAYVALSRATSQEGLQILNFNPKKVMAHDKVRKFYDSLYNVGTTLPVDKKNIIAPANKTSDEWLGNGYDDDDFHYVEQADYA